MGNRKSVLRKFLCHSYTRRKLDLRKRLDDASGRYHGMWKAHSAGKQVDDSGVTAVPKVRMLTMSAIKARTLI
jgi:hypothetical protein